MWEQIQNKNHCVDKMVSVTSQRASSFSNIIAQRFITCSSVFLSFECE